MRPSCVAGAAAASAQNGERPKLPEAPSARLPKPARSRSRRAMPPRRDEIRVTIGHSKNQRQYMNNKRLVTRCPADKLGLAPSPPGGEGWGEGVRGLL